MVEQGEVLVDEWQTVDRSKSITPSKTFRFKQVCHELVEAVPMSVREYQIQQEEQFHDSFNLFEKVKGNYDRWIEHLKSSNKSSFPELSCRGCCEIDDFTGNELLRIFHDIISKKDKEVYLFQPGDFLYFSKNQSYCAAVMFTYSKLVVSTPPETSLADNKEENQLPQYKYLFSRLFNDDHVARYKRKHRIYYALYNRDTINKLRQQATLHFPCFLNTKVRDFELYPFGYRFLAALVPIAYRICPRGNPLNMPRPLECNIPFAACLKFAFDTNQTGKIVGLCGEVGYKVAETPWKERAKSIRKYSHELINSRISLPSKKMKYDKAEVKSVARDIEQFFKTNY